MRFRKASGLAWITALSVATGAFAQRLDREPDSFGSRQRALYEQTRNEFDAQMRDAQRAAFDWGGWYSLNFMMFDDGVESSRTLRRHDLRFWSRLSVAQGAHEFYARTRLSLIDFNHGDAYDGNEDDIEGPNLERGYYRLDLAKAIRASEGREISGNLIIQAGRDLVEFGTGLTLSTPLDQVSLRADYRDFQMTLLAGKTVGSDQDFDLSRTAKRLRRSFFGGQLKYSGFERHEPFAYFLWQRDHNREAVYQPFQKYDYDSFYAGLGSTGEVVDCLRYLAEGVLETGNDYSDGRFLRDNDILAWAFRGELEYLFRTPHRTRASLEYLFGSGDPTRLGSPSNTRGGNTGDFDDNSFIGFGYVDTGLSLVPRYANLHMGRAGGSFFPWPGHDRLKHLQLGTDWYLFHKHHASAAISDPTAQVQSGYLGWEMDYYLNWRMSADFAWTARWGAFFPGDAFDDQTTRTFLLLGLVWSF